VREAAQRVHPQHLQEAAGASADLHRQLLRPDVGAAADASISTPVNEQCGCGLENHRILTVNCIPLRFPALAFADSDNSEIINIYFY